MKAHQELIYGSYDQQVLAKLADYGIDEAHLDAGKVLYDEVIALDDARNVEVGEEQDAAEQWRQTYEGEVTYYRRVRKLVKPFAAVESGMVRKLGLTGTAPSKQLEMIRHMNEVYKALVRHPDFVASLQVKWLTVEELDARAEAVMALQHLLRNFTQEQRDAVEATRVRNVKYQELASYSKLLKTKALVALEGEPHLLAKLGLG